MKNMKLPADAQLGILLLFGSSLVMAWHVGKAWQMIFVVGTLAFGAAAIIMNLHVILGFCLRTEENARDQYQKAEVKEKSAQKVQHDGQFENLWENGVIVPSNLELNCFIANAEEIFERQGYYPETFVMTIGGQLSFFGKIKTDTSIGFVDYEEFDNRPNAPRKTKPIYLRVFMKRRPLITLLAG